MDGASLVEDEELATKALESIVQVKKAELEHKRLLSEEYYLQNPEKRNPTNEFYSKMMRNCSPTFSFII